MSTPTRPVIGITMDLTEVASTRLRAECGLAYAACVVRAGGTPVFLPPIVEEIPAQLAMVDGVVFTGGGDPRMEAYGEATHPEASPMHEKRQSYETAMLEAINGRGPFAGSASPELPILGICLGMQMMSLAAGGKLEQHLPDRLGEAAAKHRGPGGAVHSVEIAAEAAKVLGVAASSGRGVASHHHQAVRDAGGLRVLARDEDGTVEAVADPKRPYYVGVQWHPERTADETLGQGIFDEFVRKCRGGA